MAFTRFSEYLEKSGKLQKTAIVDLHGDTAPPAKKTPQKAATSSKKGHWHTEAAVVDDDNGPFAYQGDGKDPGLQMAGDGPENSPPLGSRDVPQSGMVYHPKTDPAQNINVDIDQFKPTKSVNFKANAPAKTVDSAPPKPPRPFNKAENNRTESFIAQTSKLSPEKYAEFIINKHADGMKDVVELSSKIGKNSDLLEAFVREIKRKGNFSKLMEAILNQPEAYSEFALAIAGDESKAKKVAKALNETTAAPAVDDTDEDEEPNKSNGMRPKDKVMPKDASTMMPPGDQGGVDSRGKPMMKKQFAMMRPEHALIQALAGYQNIRNTMREILN